MALSKIEVHTGHAKAALSLAQEFVAICRKTGIVLAGPTALSALALASDDAKVRRSALEEAEPRLHAGALSHCHLDFHCDALEVALRARDTDAVEHHARALEEYTRAEPLPWSRFFVERARVLARFYGGSRAPALTEELRRLELEARTVGLRLAARSLAEALRATA